MKDERCSCKGAHVYQTAVVDGKIIHEGCGKEITQEQKDMMRLVGRK